MDVAEKRVFDDRTGATAVLVASDAGLAHVAVSGDVVGEFGLVHRGAVGDVAVAGGRVAVATPEDVLVGPAADASTPGDEWATATGFGPAAAVGWDDGTLLAAGGGRVARRVDGGWTTTGRVADVRAVDGALLAAADGLYRPDGTHVGLTAARDVAADGPLAATADGLYRLANGWVRDVEGRFRAVAAGGGRAHAAAGDRVIASDAPGEWADAGVPADDLVALAAGPAAVYAATADGTLCVDAGDGWRSQPLGLPGVDALAVAGFED